MSLPTLDDLEAAKAALQAALARQDAYDGNNPNKYATPVREARERVAALTRTLKASGVLARTDHGRLEARLDAAFPGAGHRDRVIFEGKRYERWWSPATRSLSGQPMTWNKGWTFVEPTGSGVD